MATCPHCNFDLSSENIGKRNTCPNCGGALPESPGMRTEGPGRTPTMGSTPDGGVRPPTPADMTLDVGSFIHNEGDEDEQKQSRADLTQPPDKRKGPEKPPAGKTSRASGPTIDFDSREIGNIDRSRMTGIWGEGDKGSTKFTQTLKGDDATLSESRSTLVVKSRLVRPHQQTVEIADPNTDLADYELIDLLGEGGMGVVYSARQASIARTVAIKMIKKGAKIDEHQRQKFMSEAVVTGELDHPNIVPIYDLGANEDGALFYSMKRVKGTPWDQVVGQKSLSENLEILLRVADAVAFAHANGVVHRDLKPENVMLGDFGEVLVMDWGLAVVSPKFRNAEAVMPPNSLGGTPAYMAPELATGPITRISEASDVYLLGAMLYEVITGRPPHTGEDVMGCLVSAANNKIQPTKQSGELVDIAMKAMATKPKDRYKSVQTFQAALRRYQSHAESIVLVNGAETKLEEARDGGNYEDFAAARYGCEQALTLWPENRRARKLLDTAKLEYAQTALANGDFDLAGSLLDSEKDEHQAILAQIDRARRERNARARRVQTLKMVVAALVIILFGAGSFAYVQIRDQRDRAKLAEADALNQKTAAEDARDEAERAEEDALRQKELADKARIAAEEAEEDALKARDAEKVAKDEAIDARNAAQEAEEDAREQQLLAEAAKEAEEYEAYVARIGLAAAKIEENAFDYALDLLAECPPELRNWEWGRLRYLCELSARDFDSPDRIDAVAFHPGQNEFVTGSRDGQVRIYNVAAGDVTASFQHGFYVHDVAYSPDGERIATASSDGTIRISDSATGETQATLKGHDESVLSVAFSRDGKWLVSGSYDNTARVWNLTSGELQQTLKGHSWWVWGGAFSPEGNQLVTVGHDGKAIVWERNSANEQFGQKTEFVGHEGPVYAVAFSPDGKRVATGGFDNLVMVWEPDKVEPVDIRRRLEGLPDPPLSAKILDAHHAAVRAVAFSDDGRLLVSGGHDNAVIIWDIEEGQQIKTLRGHGGWVRDCEFSPDGKLVLSGSHDQRAKLWNIEGYREMRVLKGRLLAGHADALLDAEFSTDGEKIVTASRDRTARIWNVSTGEAGPLLEEGHDFLATSAVFYPDGRRLATGAGDNTVRVWNVATATELFVLDHTGRSAALAVSRDGRLIATGGDDTTARVWDGGSGKLVSELSGHGSEVTAIAFSPDGGRIASGDDGGHIRLWRQTDDGWQLEHRLDGHSRSITALRFASGDRLISASGDDTVGQWNVARGKEIREGVLRHPAWVSSLDVSPDGRLAITSCEDGRARVWDLARATVVQTIGDVDSEIRDVSFSPDGRLAALTSFVNRSVQVWDIENGKPWDPPATDLEDRPLLDFKKIGGLVWTAAFAPDGLHLLSVGGNDARLWNLRDQSSVISFSPHGAVASASFSPDGRYAVTGSWDNSAKVWEVATGKAVRRLSGGHDGYINSASFSPDGSKILTASDDGTARLWDAETGDPMPIVFRGHEDRVRHAVFSPDGSRVLTGSNDATARLFDAATGDQIQVFKGHQWAVRSVAFAPDGELVVTGSEDNTARIWNVESGEEALTLAGHTAGVTSVSFSGDGERVLTGSQDSTTKLWDSESGKEILSLQGHEEEVTAVRFAPDDKSVLTASRDGTAILWLAVEWKDPAEEKPAVAAK